MKPAEEFTPQQLVGKRVAFRDDEGHHGCWHYRAGIKTAVVRRVGQSLSQKAELLQAEGLDVPELLPEEDVLRIWVFADPCTPFPQGCEAAVEVDCLLVLDA